MTKREAGRLGGKATAKKGKAYMAGIGRKGFAATVARHFAGDRRSYVNNLHCRAAENLIDRLHSASEGPICVEMPVILDPDDDPFF